MPEAFMIAYNSREIHAHADERGRTSGLPAEHPSEHGRFVLHLECLAKQNGMRPTVTNHLCEHDDPVFQPLPKERVRNGSQKTKKSKNKAPEAVTCSLCMHDQADDLDEVLQEEPKFNDENATMDYTSEDVVVIKAATQRTGQSTESSRMDLQDRHLVSVDPGQENAQTQNAGSSIALGEATRENPLHFPQNQGAENSITSTVDKALETSVSLLAKASKPDYTHLKGKTAAQIANGMEIRGQLHCAFRGKELVMAIGQFIIRVSFGMEAHCLWIPTSQYETIVSQPPVSRGQKSKTFCVPEDFCDKPDNSAPVYLSIQAAFIRPDWTLVFVDHNVMIGFHMMWVRFLVDANDIVPGGKLWKYIWSHSHGPVSHHEPEATSRTLDAWRASVLAATNPDYEAIFLRIKSNQRVFNGYGAQETTDMLFQACIHPRMPTYLVCKDDELWKSLKERTVQYQKERIASLSATRTTNKANGSKKAGYPYVSGSVAFRMNIKGHQRFLSDVPVFRRRHVRIDESMLEKIIARGLLDPDATIQDNGYAIYDKNEESIWKAGTKPSPGPTAPDPRCKRVTVQNYAHFIVAGTKRGQEKRIPMYSPFVAQAPSTWYDRTDVRTVAADVSEEVNDTTIGPFSFRVFVDCGFTSKYTAVAERPKGRRSSVMVDGRVRKRLRVESWGGDQESRAVVVLGKEAVEEPSGDEKAVDGKDEQLQCYVTQTGRSLRARKKASNYVEDSE